MTMNALHSAYLSNPERSHLVNIIRQPVIVNSVSEGKVTKITESKRSAKRYLTNQLRFVSSHLRLLAEYCKGKVASLQLASPTVKAQKQYWCDQITQWDDGVDESKSCRDCFIHSVTIKSSAVNTHRYVNTFPNETISLDIVYSLRQRKDLAPQYLFLYIDDKNCYEIDSVQDNSVERGTKSIVITAPSKAGLYMLWCGTSGGVAECTSVDEKYSGFCIWLQVNRFFGENTLRNAVSLWFSDRDTALKLYGDISTWDTSEVMKMRELFKDRTDFNYEDIMKWDLTKVTDTTDMFKGVKSFDKFLTVRIFHVVVALTHL